MTLSIQIDCDRRFFRRYRNDSRFLTWSLQLNDLKHEHHRLRI